MRLDLFMFVRVMNPGLFWPLNDAIIRLQLPVPIHYNVASDQPPTLSPLTRKRLPPPAPQSTTLPYNEAIAPPTGSQHVTSCFRYV